MRPEPQWRRRLREAQRRGVRLLDRTIPKWWTKIDVDLLDMSDCTFCVMGQIGKDYCLGLEKLARLAPRATRDTDYSDKVDGAQYGFDVARRDWRHMVEGHALLGELWIAAIQRRRTA